MAKSGWRWRHFARHKGRMRYCTITFVTALGCDSGITAQEANPLSAELRQNYSQQKGALLSAAEKMPAADYSFKATPEVGTFGSRVAHVAEAQFMICSAVKGESKKADAASKTSKADLVAALKASFDYCDGAYGSLTDATATQMVKIFGMPQTKLSALWGNLAHDGEMYGYMAVYLRLRGIVPP